MYQLYHIKRKKWGCSNQLKKRLKAQNYSIEDCCEIISVKDKNEASILEKKLNLEFGYEWNDSQDYRTITKICSEGGKVGGKTNAKSGHLKSICRMGVIPKPILVFNYKTNSLVGEFKSINETSKKLGLNISQISQIANGVGNRKQHKGYTFKFK